MEKYLNITIILHNITMWEILLSEEGDDLQHNVSIS